MKARVSLLVMALLGALFAFAVEACAGAPAIVVEAQPPPPRVLVFPAERRGYVWAPGYWRWSAHHFVWVDGRWIRARHGRHWVAAHWEPRHGRFHFVEGHWVHQR